MSDKKYIKAIANIEHNQAAIKAHQANLPDTGDAGDGLILCHINADVLSYWNTLLLIVPIVTTTTQYNIGFYKGDSDSPLANICRFCVEHFDEDFRIQDELFFPLENEGGQLNFEIKNVNKTHLGFLPLGDSKPTMAFVKAPKVLSKYFVRFVAEVQLAAKIKGSFISVTGYGKIMESDGEKWVFKTETSGQKMLDANASKKIMGFDEPYCQNHSGRREFGRVAFKTEKGLLFSSEEAISIYEVLYVAGKAALIHSNWYADLSEWQELNRSLTLPIENKIEY
jgi:hypothetical protein